MTIEEFGQTIKQKYPQYSGLSDLQVGQKMLAKHPQYQSKITEQVRDTDILEKVTKVVTTIFPGKTFGEAIGTAIAKKKATKEEKEFIAPGPSKKELVGEAIRTGTFVASMAAGGGGIATQAVRMAGLGAAAAGGTALIEDKSLKDAAKSAFVAGFTGAGS